MRVLLIYPNAYKELLGYMDKMAITEPLALEYVAAGAKLDGHEVRLLDLRLHVEKLRETLAEYQPDLVGVTGFSMHVLRNLEICTIAKELVPHCKTAVGGIHATLEPVDFFEPQIDYVFIGEGVQAFRQVLMRLEKDETVEGIPGVYYRLNGKFERTEMTIPFDLNALPIPDRTLVPEDRSGYVIDCMKPVALIRTSVGCPYRCTFCSVWRIMNGRHYERDITEVVQELESIPEKYVHLVDDEAFVKPKRMRKLAHDIKHAGINKEYYAYSRVETLLRNRDLMAQWAEIGLRRFFIGVETIFEHELAEYNKQQPMDDIIKVHRITKEMGIKLYSGFIIHPSYTEKEFKAVEKFILENGIECPSFTVWTPLPGIEDGGTNYNKVIRLQENGRPDWSELDFQHPVIETKLPRHEFMMRYGLLYQRTSMHGRANKPVFSEGNHPLPTNLVSSGVQTFDDFNRKAHIELARIVLNRKKRS